MQELTLLRHGELLPINGADELFSELLEQVSALNENHICKNMGNDIMIAKCKKYLSSGQYDIEYVDLVERLGNDAYDIINAKYNFALTQESFSNYLELHKSAITPLIGIAILAIRWGKWYHIKPFGELLVKYLSSLSKTARAS
ncbi:MAG: hypothetical protein NC453_16775 [Muribaculum sp.]|nr:hypothetical protein [Muribaculum sp.]